MKPGERQALLRWDRFLKGFSAQIEIDPDEPADLIAERRTRLQGNFEAFCSYYFPHYCSSPFAAFHRRFAKAVIENETIYVSRAWSRDHAKSVVAGLLLPAYLMFTGRLNNMLLVSYSWDNACELLRPLKLELERNPRLIQDYGKQRSLDAWEADKFVTTDSKSFRAIGSGQNPRGTREQEARPDYIVVDDIDEDTLVRNPKRLNEAWDWLMGALYGTLSIDKAKRFVVVGNIIARDSMVVRAAKVSDNHEQIDLLTKSGKPSWKERFSLEQCQYMITKMGYRLAQREYFNNPIAEGTVFKKDWIQYKKLPALRFYQHLVAYLDPGFKKTATTDTKAWILVGLYKGELHVIKAFCGQATVQEMIAWGYELQDYVTSRSGACQLMMEEVFLQDLLYKDFDAEAKRRGTPLPLQGDKRAKPNKDQRIEALSGYFERGTIYFNQAESENHHMVALEEQLLNFEVGVKTPKDGPDALEGAIFQLNSRVRLSADIDLGRGRTNKHRV